MQSTLTQFSETQSEDAFALQNSKLLKVRLDQVTVQVKLGAMVAYQGDVTFEHAGSGGLGRMLKKAVTGEGSQLMKVTGSGEVFLADQAQDIHLLFLENDLITVNGPNLLAFDSGIDWDIKRVEGASGMVSGGLYNMALHGTGWVAILSDGPPVMLDVSAAPTYADAQAAITWSSGVQTGLKTDFKMKNLIGRASGRASRCPSAARAGCSCSRPKARCAAPSPESARHPVLDVHDLAVAVGGVVHHLLAARAPPAGLERRAARLVAVRLAAAGARAPVGEQPQRAGQLAAGLRQLVHEPRRPVGVRLRDHQRLLGERLQARAEHVRRDPVERLLELVEAARAVEQRRDHEQRPAVADAREGVGERRRRRMSLLAHAERA